MSNFSLRLPYLIYLSIGSLLLGVLVAPAFRDIPEIEAPMAPVASEQHHMHGMLEIPSVGAPQIEMDVVKDPTGGWSIALRTANFTFTPGAVNKENTPNTGHAHLYVGDQKMARLYGPYFHMPDLAPGQHEIRVVLSSNDHSFYAIDGTPIEARAIVMQGELPNTDS